MSVTAPPVQQPPQPQPQPSSDAFLIGTITVILLAGLTDATAVTAIAAVLAPAGVSAAIVSDVLGLVTGAVHTTLAGGPASIYTAASEPSRRAAFILAACRRLTAGGSVADEQTYLRQHLQAARARAGAALTVDQAVVEHGTVLGWQSREDSHVEAICARLNGSNFDVTHPPMEGYPGQPHGGTCRCVAVAPFQ